MLRDLLEHNITLLKSYKPEIGYKYDSINLNHCGDEQMKNLYRATVIFLRGF
jgi:hypothetical protein